jgi:hypothetical protein
MTSVIKPITPDQVGAMKLQVMPSQVIEAFNQIIAEAYSSRSKSARLMQNKVVERILMLCADDHTVTEDTIFDNNWLDVEILFEEAGWKVSYDKPGYNESYEASWTFRAK